MFDAETAERRGRDGERVILVRWETAPDDYGGMRMAAGILTAHGGLTSHAAVVARGEGHAVCRRLQRALARRGREGGTPRRP